MALLLALGLVAPAPVPATAAPARAAAVAPVAQLRVPLVLGHRGAPGHRPEHTLASYGLAIRQGAGWVEPDVVSTKDGVLVVRHENEIGSTTDVAEHPEFARRRTTKRIDGVAVTGWFAEDFTLRELRTLRARERVPDVRPGSARYDGRFGVPTLAQVLGLVASWERRLGRRIGVAVETKHPTYFDAIGLSLEEPLLRTLARYGRNRARGAVLIQSFEVTNLRRLNRVTRVPLLQLTRVTGGPFDLRARGMTYARLTSAAGLRAVRRYAEWVGPQKDQVLPLDATESTGAPSPLVRDAHRAGLRVGVWAVRPENLFLPANFRTGDDPHARGDVAGEVDALLDAGVDGLFCDVPDSCVAARDARAAR